MVNAHMKKFSTPLIIREMQIRPIIRYCYTPTLMVKIKKADNPCVGKELKKPQEAHTLLLGI